MRIQHNILAMNAYRNYTNNTSALSKNLEKLSSGYKINRAGDDAAGLAISEKMRAQITGLEAAQKNVKDGVSLVKTAEGALSEVHDMLNRMAYLATQSANGTYDGTDRVQLQKELDQLRTEINRISEASNFNGIKLLDGSMDASGGIKTVSSLSRMLSQVGTGAGNVGRVTILDSDPRIDSGSTIFEMDFTGLSTSKKAASSPPKPPQDPQDPTGASASMGTTNFTANDVSQVVNFTLGSASKAVITVGDYTFTINNPGVVKTAIATSDWTGSGKSFTLNATASMTTQQILQSIVDKLKTVSGNSAGTKAIISVKNAAGTKSVNLEVSVSGNNGLKFTATSAAAAHAAFGAASSASGAANFKDAIEGAVSATSPKAPTNTNPLKDVKTSVGQEAKATQASSAAVWTVNINLDTDGSTYAVADGKKIEVIGKIGDQDVKITITNSGGTYTAAVATTSGTPLSSKYKASYAKDTGVLTITALDKGAQKLVVSAVSTDDETGGLNAKTAEGVVAVATTGKDYAAGQAARPGTASITFKLGDVKAGDKIALGSKTLELTEANLGSENTLVAAINALASSANFTIHAAATAGGTITITLTEKVAGSQDENALKGSIAYTEAPSPSSASAEDGIAVANNDGIAVANTSSSNAAKISFGLKIAGQTLVNAASVAAEATAGQIADAVWAELLKKYEKASDGSINIKLDINGATYKVTHEAGSAKLKFELTDAPTEANINGNFDWNITGQTEYFGDNHTGGTIVKQAGRAVVANQAANTIFRIEQGDIKDGATFTINAHDEDGNAVSKTVTLHIGQNNTDTSSDVYLTEEEAKNLGTVLSRISKAFGSRVGDLEIGVNDKSNGDGHMGITVKHINTHGDDEHADNVYLTMEDFAKVFELKVPRNPEGTGLTLQIGDTADSYNQLAVSIAACDSAALGLDGVDISTQVGAENAINVIKSAINYVSDVRGTLGATQNRLEHTQNNLSVMAENIQDAESTIRDTDVAEEMMSYVKNNILIQSAQAMLAQANQIPQGVLQLLG